MMAARPKRHHLGRVSEAWSMFARCVELPVLEKFGCVMVEFNFDVGGPSEGVMS
jgi:hypothetical protein